MSKSYTTCPSCKGQVEVTELAHLGACEKCISDAHDAYQDFLEEEENT